MLSSLNKQSRRTSGLYGSSERSDSTYGSPGVCELCGEDRQCFDRFGMETCQPCELDLLPASSLL